MSAHSRARECALAGPRVRARRAESAHSQGRKCALANRKVRTRKSESAHSGIGKCAIADGRCSRYIKISAGSKMARHCIESLFVSGKCSSYRFGSGRYQLPPSRASARLSCSLRPLRLATSRAIKSLSPVYMA